MSQARYCNGYYNDWQRMDGKDSPREGAVGVVMDMGIAERLGSIDDIRTGDLAQGYRKKGGRVGHQFQIGQVVRGENGKVLSYEMVSANLGSGNAIEYQIGDRDYYAEIHIARLYDSSPDVPE